MIEHKQAPIMQDGEVVFTVDEKLQSLVQYLLDNGFETYHSCEDDIDGMTFVEYAIDDWIAITEIAFRNSNRELYEFILDQCDVLLQPFDDGFPDDGNERWVEGDNLVWIASVTFPSEHLPHFEKLVRSVLRVQQRPARIQ